MKVLLAFVVIASCAFTSHQSKPRLKRDGWSVDLADAIIAGQSEIVKMLIDRGADVNAKSTTEDTPLIIASFHGYDEIVKMLIDRGAKVNSKNIIQVTPLHSAAWNGHDKIVEILVNNGANTNAKNGDGKTARNVAAEKGYRKIADWLDAATGNVPVRNAHEACKKYTKAPPSDFIAHGRPVEPEELPWMAALGYVDDVTSGIRFQCGGVVISERFILTATHCTSRKSPPVVVRLGKVNINVPGRRSKNYFIKDIIRNDGYSGELKKHDIALLRLTEDIVFTPAIRPACLETNLDDQDPSVKLIVSGWGANSTLDTETSDILLKAEVQTIPLSECNATYLEYNKDVGFKAFRSGISQSQYCAYDPTGKGDSCHGDSGGPLQIFHNSYTAHIVGIVSFGVSCGTRLPTIYTRVAYYVDWIESHVWKD